MPCYSRLFLFSILTITQKQIDAVDVCHLERGFVDGYNDGEGIWYMWKWHPMDDLADFKGALATL